jgi:CDP-diacylglycerol--glycerol-3-phosphate 3-phosphatidyltransferase
MRQRKSLRFWIPQSMTGLRLIAGPVLLYTLSQELFSLSLFLILFATLTDWLDGYLARKFDSESSFGRIFDPIADKVFIACLFGYLMCTELPFLALGIVIIFRDVLILSGASYLKIKNPGLELNPTYISKINTALTMGCSFLAIFTKAFLNDVFTTIMHNVHTSHVFITSFKFSFLAHMPFLYRLLSISVLLLFYSSFITTILSGVAYARIFVLLHKTK